MDIDQWERAYVLHRRPYKNTSYILDVWTQEKGRLALVAQSARGQKSRFKGQLEPFTPLRICWRGRGDLKTLTHADVMGLPYDLVGMPLWCGFYLNELLLRLLPLESPYPAVFGLYEDALREMQKQVIHAPLRQFEMGILECTGYALPLAKDVSGDEIVVGRFYRYLPDQGFLLCEQSDDHFVFAGDLLCELKHNKALGDADAQAAKRLLRLAMAPHLGNKPLKSRDLIKSLSAKPSLLNFTK